MSRIDWLLIAPIVGCLMLAGVAENDHNNWQCTRALGQHEQDNARVAIMKPSLNSDTAKAVSRNCWGAYDETRTCDAITANAAVDQACYSFWQTIAAWIIGSGTLIAAVLAGYWAMKAAEETKRSATAAEAEQRAWLSIKCRQEIKFEPADRDGEFFRAIFASKVENHGASVATDVHVHARVIFPRDYALFEKAKFPEIYHSIIRKVDQSGGTIFPKGVELFANSIKISAREIEMNKTEYGYIFPLAIVCLQYRTPHLKNDQFNAIAFQIKTEGSTVGYDGILVGDPSWMQHDIRLGEVIFSHIT